MVEQITQFRTTDGRTFDNADKANQHERIVISITKFMDSFPNKSKLSGEKYYQLTQADVRFRKTLFCEMLRAEYANDKSTIAAINAYESHNLRGALIGRILDDGDSPFYRVWILFECIDDHYRMFQQPYYVYNPPANAVQIPH